MLAIESSNTPTNALVVTDASVKNNITISIAHIHVHNKPLIKTLHHAVHVTSSKAEFFAIRCSINQAVISHEISKIIIITDSIHVAKKIFNLSLYMLSKQVAFILKDLRCYETLWTLIFFFSFIYFFLILYFFSFEFLFLFFFSNDEEARDIAVT